MSQKGVTLIQLAIIIIILLIITSFAVFQSSNITDNAIMARHYEGIKEVKKAVEQTVLLMEINPDTYEEGEIFGAKIGEAKDDYYSRIGLSSADELSDRTYIINHNNQYKLELEKIAEEEMYIVDLENEKYYLVDGFKTKSGERLYEYTDISKEYNLLSNKK